MSVCRAATSRLMRQAKRILRAGNLISMAIPPLVEPSAPLSAAEVERYARHVLIPDVGMEGQRRLKNARVLVVGAGGLGSPALTYLAAAAVGTIGLVAADVLKALNLQQQLVVPHPVRLTAGNAQQVLAGYDLVLDGADNFSTRYLVSDACTMAGLPEVWGSVFRFDGQVSVFWSGQGPTYRDLFPEMPPAGSVPSCAEGGVLGAMCAAVGAVMATVVERLVDEVAACAPEPPASG